MFPKIDHQKQCLLVPKEEEFLWHRQKPIVNFVVHVHSQMTDIWSTVIQLNFAAKSKPYHYADLFFSLLEMRLILENMRLSSLIFCVGWEIRE